MRATSSSINPRCDGLRFGVLDLEGGAKSDEQHARHGVPPLWRWLWSELADTGTDVVFLELTDRGLRSWTRPLPATFDWILVHVDNHVPHQLAAVLQQVRLAMPGCVMAACGYLPTLEPERVLQALPGLSCLLRGPIECVLPQVVEIVRKDIPLADASNLSWPGSERPSYSPPSLTAATYDSTRNPLPGSLLTDTCFQSRVGVVQSSLGCPRTCSFCRSSAFYHRFGARAYAIRSIASVLEEIEYLHRTCGIDHFKFFDLNFLGTPSLAIRRAREFAEGVGSLPFPITFEFHCRTDAITADVLDVLVPCGLVHLAAGIESMSGSQLARYEKGESIEEHRRAVRLLATRGLMAQGYAILCDPLVTRQELLESLEGLQEISATVLVLIHERMILYRSTPYFDRWGDRISTRPFSSSLGAVLAYEFADPWLRQNFPLLEAASFRLKAATASPGVGASLTPRATYRYARAAASLRLGVLQRMAECEHPCPDTVMEWTDAAAACIPSLFTRAAAGNQP